MPNKLITKLLNFDNVTALQFFQLMRYVVLFLCGVILVKSGWSAVTIGEYEKTFFWSGIISFFWVNGIVMTMLSNYKSNNLRPYLFNTYLILVFFSLFSLLILKLVNPLVGNSINVRIFYLFIFFNNTSYLTEYVYMLRNKPRKVVLYGIVVFTCQIMAVIAGSVFYKDINVLVIFLLVLAVFKNIWMLFLLWKYSTFVIDYDIIKRHLVLASPLILAALLGGAIDYVNKLIITWRYDSATFAIYQFGARELPLSVIVANAFSNAMLPKVAENIDTALSEIKRRAEKLMHWLFPLSIILMFLSKYLYTIFYSSSYLASADIFNIFLLLVVSRLVFPQTLLIGLGKQNIILRTSLIENIFHVVFVLILGYFYGIKGIAWAIVLAYLIEKLYLIYYCRKYLNIPIVKYVRVWVWCCYSSIMIILYLIL